MTGIYNRCVIRTMRFWAVTVAAAIGGMSPLGAGTVNINFDNLAAGTVLSDQYAGVTFNGAFVEPGYVFFPARSAPNEAIFNENLNFTTLVFDSPIDRFAGYFTYEGPIAVAAFDETGVEVGSARSAEENNLGGCVPSDVMNCPLVFPNELFQVASSAGISRVTITPDILGTTFSFDDVSLTTSTPEPGGAWFAGGFLAMGLIGFRRWRA